MVGLKIDNEEHYINTNYGYCYFQLAPFPAIYNLYVYPEYRGKGLSERLLAMIIFEIESNLGDVEIFIEVDPMENCMSKEKLKEFYISMGLTILDNTNKDH